MRSLSLLSLSVLLLSPAALAQTPEVVDSDSHGPGVGVEQNLGGLTGAAFSYDTGPWRIDVLGSLGHFNEDGDDSTVFGFGGRFFFELHQMPEADFSLGGGLALVLTEVGDFSDTILQLEAAAQIRVWLVPNVAFSGSLGFVILSADDGQVVGGPVAGGNSANSIYGIGGQLTAALGVIYYFR